MNKSTTKILNQLISYNGQILSHRDVIEIANNCSDKRFTNKFVSVRRYSTKRVNLEYIELKRPKYEYLIGNDMNTYIAVPKLVYDLIFLPERRSE